MEQKVTASKIELTPTKLEVVVPTLVLWELRKEAEATGQSVEEVLAEMLTFIYTGSVDPDERSES